jgi:hypothetical protein
MLAKAPYYLRLFRLVETTHRSRIVLCMRCMMLWTRLGTDLRKARFDSASSPKCREGPAEVCGSRFSPCGRETRVDRSEPVDRKTLAPNRKFIDQVALLPEPDIVSVLTTAIFAPKGTTDQPVSRK